MTQETKQEIQLEDKGIDLLQLVDRPARLNNREYILIMGLAIQEEKMENAK